MSGVSDWGLLRRRKRRFGPTRALYATDGMTQGTATWEKKLNFGYWQCISASKFLRWMVGMQKDDALKKLKPLQWHWIKPWKMDEL